jgi:hypothetical protein
MLGPTVFICVLGGVALIVDFIAVVIALIFLTQTFPITFPILVVINPANRLAIFIGNDTLCGYRAIWGTTRSCRGQRLPTQSFAARLCNGNGWKLLDNVR